MARESPPSLWLMGRMVLAGRGVPAAANFLKRARKAHPDDFWINFDLSHMLSLQPDGADQALIYATTAVALRPRSSAAHMRRGAIQDQRLHHEDAEAEYREAIRLRPDNGPAHARLAMMLGFSLGRDAEAVDEFRQAIMFQPERANSARTLLIHHLTRLRRFDEVVSELEEAAKSSPNQVAPLIQIAHARICRRDTARASAAIERGPGSASRSLPKRPNSPRKRPRWIASNACPRTRRANCGPGTMPSGWTWHDFARRSDLPRPPPGFMRRRSRPTPSWRPTPSTGPHRRGKACRMGRIGPFRGGRTARRGHAGRPAKPGPRLAPAGIRLPRGSPRRDIRARSSARGFLPPGLAKRGRIRGRTRSASPGRAPEG